MHCILCNSMNQSMSQHMLHSAVVIVTYSAQMLQSATVCYSMLEYTVAYCSTLQYAKACRLARSLRSRLMKKVVRQTGAEQRKSWLYYTKLYSVMLRYTILHYIMLQLITLQNNILSFTILHCIYLISLHPTTLLDKLKPEGINKVLNFFFNA